MKDIFSIGEIATIKGITIKALRHYDKIGLLKPHYIDPCSGYRYYSKTQFLYLDIIKISKDIGISLSDLKIIFEEKETEILMEYLCRYKKLALSKIEELNYAVDLITNIEKNRKDSINSINKKSIYYKKIAKRSIVSILHTNIDESQLLLEYSNLHNYICKNKFIDTYETGILYNLDFTSNRIFSNVKLIEDSNIDILESIPGGRYLCLSYNKDSLDLKIKELHSFIKSNGIIPKLILEVDLFNNIFSEDNYSCEIQVLI